MSNRLMLDLSQATPRIGKYFAAAVRNGVYAVAQCVETVAESTCDDCLSVAYRNIEGCPPDAEARAVDAGCFMRYSDEAFFPANQTVDLNPFLDSGSSSKKGAIIGGVVGGAGGLILLAFAVFLWIRRSRKSQRGGIIGVGQLQGPLNFRYRDLKAATDNFSEKNKLGEGGFGSVYKGTLKCGTVVAVKRLTVTAASRAKESFQSEVKLISNVHHRNLVRLLGCCGKGPELLLVYEYMANSSLDKLIFGLNVLSLNMSFSLLRGYTAPEYAIHGQLSEKVDTYSYGVVVLEIVSGRKCNATIPEPSTQYLLEWAWTLYEEDMLLNLVDDTLDPNEYQPDEVKRVIEIALLCTQSTVTARPTMSEIIVMLLSRGGSLTQPTRPVFIDAASRLRGDMSTSSGATSASNATISISQFSAR
ncbi:hypothetical protein J5N97_016252 [Dioscorea zingiberensis]|uniref:Uncharacterized protein n=1 Tax=Dioscorea zingiberensis TaxID=325984 RepID=A0A9D5CJH0_9LILI|nr:hypothetical protein J5N97_016252 [Dioscorea zingiberensis]